MNQRMEGSFAVNTHFSLSAFQLSTASMNGLFTEVLLAGLCIGSAVAAERPGVHLARESPPVELLQMVNPMEWRPRADEMTPLRQRVYFEVTGARAQAEDWLRNAGMSVLEEHDPEGHRSFTLLSDAAISESSVIHLRARFGRPEVAAGLHLRQNTATIGMMIPWQQSVFELEAVNDRSLGYGFLASMHWRDALDRFECGIAVPMAAGGVGVLLQLRMRFGQ